MWNFVSADKAQLALSDETKFHIQKCNTCRYIENPSRRICYHTMAQYIPRCAGLHRRRRPRWLVCICVCESRKRGCSHRSRAISQLEDVCARGGALLFGRGRHPGHDAFITRRWTFRCTGVCEEQQGQAANFLRSRRQQAADCNQLLRDRFRGQE